jgi:hypothetical protein
VIGFIALLASLMLIGYHETMIYRNISPEDKASNWKSFQSTAIFGSSQKIIDFIAFICLAMTVFDSNQNILQIKNEMQKPSNFMMITSLGFFSYALCIIPLATLSYLSFGKHLQIPIIDNGFGFNGNEKILEIDQKVLFGAKVMFVMNLLACLYMYQNRLFQAMSNLSTMVTEGRNADNSNILDRIDDSLDLE